MYCPGVEVMLWGCCNVQFCCVDPVVGVAMYSTGVELLLWGGGYGLSWCGGAVVGRLLCIFLVCKCCCGDLLCTVMAWICCCREAARYCPGVEDLLWGGSYELPCMEFLLWGGCYVLSWCAGVVVGWLLCNVLVRRSCCGEAAIYCPDVEVLLWGGCYVLSWCGGAVVGRLLCTVLV